MGELRVEPRFRKRGLDPFVGGFPLEIEGAPLAGLLAVRVAWQLGFGFAVPLFAVATAVIYVTVPGDGGRSEAANSDSGDIRETVRRIRETLWNRPVVIVTAVQTMGYCVWQAFTGFYPTYLIEVKGLAPTTATILFGAFFALGILVKPIAGSAYDAHGLRRSLPVVLVSITAVMVLLPLVDGLAALVAVTALASSVLGYGTITLTYLTDSFPDDVRGTGLGFLRTGYMLIGAGSPTVVGALADMGYFDEAFFLLGGLAATAAIFTLFVPER